MDKDFSGKFCRRVYRRYKADTTAYILSLGDLIEKPLLLRDLSSRGAGIVSYYPLHVNGLITIILAIPFLKESVSRQARVIWSRKIDNHCWGSGIDFGSNHLVDME